MTKNLKYILAGVVLLLLIILVSAYYYREYYFSSKEKELVAMSIQQSKPALDAFNSDNYTQSIDELPALIAKAPNNSERGRLQLLLASSYIYRNQGNDLTQGISILEQITNDYSIASWVRALALNNIAAVVSSNNLTFYKTQFTKPPFDSYLSNSGSDGDRVSSAYLKILQESDETFPNSSAEYSIAKYYSDLILNNKVPKEEKAKTATLMQKYIAEGDALNDQKLYSPSTILYGQYNRALAFIVSGSILGNVNLTDQENAYKQILTAANTYEQAGQSTITPFIASALFTTRFAYADFLLQNFKNTRNDDIRALLQPFSTITIQSSGVLANLTDASSTDTNTRVEASKLAQISPDFKKFLTASGVTLTSTK